MKHQKKAEGHIGRNVVSITIKMKIEIGSFEIHIFLCSFLSFGTLLLYQVFLINTNNL